MRKGKKTYDLIASLGGDCSAASQLRLRGLRHEAYPFDWTYIGSDRALDYLIDGFGDGFSDFALKGNLELMPDMAMAGTAKYQFRDVHTGFWFIHHFNERIDRDEEAYNRAVMPIRRRIDRFLSKFNASKDVLFILVLRINFDPHKVVALRDALNRMYPDKNIDLHVTEWNVNFDNPSVLSESWPAEYGFAGGARYRQSPYPYACALSGSEWRLLDEVELRGVAHARPKGLAKAVYKVWKHLGKWLNKRGYKT